VEAAGVFFGFVSLQCFFFLFSWRVKRALLRCVCCVVHDDEGKHKKQRSTEDCFVWRRCVAAALARVTAPVSPVRHCLVLTFFFSAWGFFFGFSKADNVPRQELWQGGGVRYGLLG
jgi:hypothetical protein